MSEITIIVPVYNVEKYLRECLDSLLCQSFSDFELLCIDDGSTDHSAEILQEYAERDRRIRLICKKNEGYGKTMNLGLAKANSPYIGIVESDDFVKPEMFEKLYRTMKTADADLVKCNFYKYSVRKDWNGEPSNEYAEELFGRIIEPLDYPELYFAHASVWCGLYSRKFLDDNGIRFEETPGASYQDISFQFRVLSDAKKMFLIKDALLYYRSDNLMSSVNSPYKVFCVCDEIHAIERYISSQEQDRQERLWPILAKKKYYDYRWNFGKIAEVFQYSFYEKAVAEFIADRRDGKFDRVEWIAMRDKDIFEDMTCNPQAHFMNLIKGKADKRAELAKTLLNNLPEFGFWGMMKGADRIVIYGAGKVGKEVACRLLLHGLRTEQLVFGVTDWPGKDETQIIYAESGCEMAKLPVREIDSLLDTMKKQVILISVKGDTQIEMLNYLKDRDCSNVLLADRQVMAWLRSENEGSYDL